MTVQVISLFFKVILQNTEVATLITTVLLAIIGWIIALFLQRSNIKKEHQVAVRYDIYKQLVETHRPVQEAISELYAQASPPFILMESNMIPYNLKLPKEFRDGYITYTEDECVFKGEQDWVSFVQSLTSNYFDYTKKYYGFMAILEDWSALLKELLQIKKVLSVEIKKLNDEIYENLTTLRDYPYQQGHDWRKWDRKKIEENIKKAQKNSYIAQTYLVDFMTLVHNKLLSKYFKYEKPLRKTLDPEYLVLTEKGLTTRLEKDYKEITQSLNLSETE